MNSDQVNQTPSPQAEGQPPADDGQPITLTRAELQKRLDETEEKAVRRMMGYTDQQTVPVRARIKALEDGWAVAAAAGKPVDDATKAAIKSHIIQEAEIAKYNEQQPGAASPQASGTTPQVDTSLRDILTEDAQEAGVYIMPDDPEFAQLDFSKSRSQVIRDHAAALEAKKARLSSPQPTTQPAQSLPPRIPGMTGGTAGGDREETLTRRLTEIQRVDPFGSNPTLREERAKIVKELGRL